MTDEQFASLMYFVGIFQGVAISEPDTVFRMDLLGAVIGMTNVINEIRKGE